MMMMIMLRKKKFDIVSNVERILILGLVEDFFIVACCLMNQLVVVVVVLVVVVDMPQPHHHGDPNNNDTPHFKMNNVVASLRTAPTIWAHFHHIGIPILKGPALPSLVGLVCSRRTLDRTTARVVWVGYWVCRNFYVAVV